MEEKLKRLERENREQREEWRKERQDLHDKSAQNQNSIARLTELVDGLVKKLATTERTGNAEVPSTSNAQDTYVPKDTSQGVVFTVRRAVPSRYQSQTQYHLSATAYKPVKDPASMPPNLNDPVEQARLGIGMGQKSEVEGKVDELAKTVRQLQGLIRDSRIDTSTMSLVDDLVLPAKFKTPELAKYDGTKCPRTHLILYHRAMANYEGNDKIMIHCFQNSLVGGAAEWLLSLKRGDVISWNDLANQFVSHFQHLIDMAPTRVTLTTMERKSSETFKEYARRWHEVAARVKPPLNNAEFSSLFIGNLKNPFYDMLLILSGDDFSKVIQKGEFLENEIKAGRIENSSTATGTRG